MRISSHSQLLQYFCSKCGAFLKETPIQILPTNEDCPRCGHALAGNLETRPNSQTTFQPAKFYNVYDLLGRLAFDIESIDKFLNLEIGDRLCIAGSERANSLLVARLCVHSLMSKRHGGFSSPFVIFVDAGNNSDIYQCVNFARQYGQDISDMLQRIIVSRVFTIHQLANLVIYELPKVIRQYNPKLVVISDLLDMFEDDPFVRISEARRLIAEILGAINEIKALVIVSVSQPSTTYADKKFLGHFSKQVMTERARRGFDIKISSNSRHANSFLAEKDLLAIQR